MEPQRFHFAPIEVRSLDAIRYRLAQKGLDTPNSFMGHKVQTNPADSGRDRIKDAIW